MKLTDEQYLMVRYFKDKGYTPKRIAFIARVDVEVIIESLKETREIDKNVKRAVRERLAHVRKL